ncbi:MAG: acetyl-CoA carboxylase biotin carboxyl carrier protein subunit [Bdellovibrionaceae bacterium]|nr:acetyl-CoA carboxylase biotin carboxyl carrier protein subunit [Pseudobdellovibrionaceae bacterium]|tara:strand:- start:23008 stop:23532 length:525 start_codon:yes stop_codon:yes gene_type:complete
MFFEAELRGIKYRINVNETPSSWKVTLQANGERPELHVISKEDYKELDGAISFLFEGDSYMVDVVGNGISYTVYTRGSYRDIPIYNDEMLLHESLKAGDSLGGPNQLAAGMPGKIVKIMVEEGQRLKQDQPILIMEAMKMENEIRAPREIVVDQIKVAIDDNVETGSVMVTFKH